MNLISKRNATRTHTISILKRPSTRKVERNTKLGIKITIPTNIYHRNHYFPRKHKQKYHDTFFIVTIFHRCSSLALLLLLHHNVFFLLFFLRNFIFPSSSFHENNFLFILFALSFSGVRHSMAAHNSYCFLPIDVTSLALLPWQILFDLSTIMIINI